jgi:hypothetical protein
LRPAFRATCLGAVFSDFFADFLAAGLGRPRTGGFRFAVFADAFTPRRFASARKNRSMGAK